GDPAPQYDRYRRHGIPEVTDRIPGVGEAGEHVGVPQGDFAVATKADLGQDRQRGALVVLARLLELAAVEVQQRYAAERRDYQKDEEPLDEIGAMRERVSHAGHSIGDGNE